MTKGIFNTHMMLCSAIKAEGREKEEGAFKVRAFAFYSNFYMC